MPKVHIVNSNNQYEQMFVNRGWDLVDNIKDCDLIQLTGGHDVHPDLYNADIHPTTAINSIRDKEDSEAWDYAQHNGVPITGICRGSQFLHVMNKGWLYQDVNNHAVGGLHAAKIMCPPNTEIMVTSTHHQMMGKPEIGNVLMTAKLSTRKEKDTRKFNYADREDIEAMYYPDTKSLSFQPHPEFEIHNPDVKECADTYFFFINNYLLGE